MQRLAIFDLDGTITRHGTLPSYIAGLLGQRPWQLARVLRAAPVVVAYLLGRADRGALKARLLRATLGDRGRAELQEWTVVFVRRLLDGGLRSDALRAIERHRQHGDKLVLLSASPDLYVPAIGSALGFDEVISTGLGWTGEHLNGALTTANRRGSEKTRCLAELERRHPRLRTAAYGNDAADLDHLRRVDEPLLVCGSRRARREAVRAGIPSASWR
ncbi:MAG: HAD-IB family phosphatase [Steroidobacteraceae bacterium]